MKKPENQIFALALTAIIAVAMLRIAVAITHRMLWQPGRENMPATIATLLWLLLATLLGWIYTLRATCAAGRAPSLRPRTVAVLGLAWMVAIFCALTVIFVFTQADYLEWTGRLW
jgi:membrane protease YdiL (CAAX protease family)